MDKEIELWDGDVKGKYRVIITVEAQNNYGTEKQREVKNVETLKKVFEQYLKEYNFMPRPEPPKEWRVGIAK